MRLFLVLLLFLPSFISIGYGQWVPDGVVVCDEVEDQDLPVITTDGRGGAIIVWEDSRDWATNYWDMYVQRVDSAGYMRWTPNGFPLCDTVGSQVDPSIVPDGFGGAIVAWDDHRGSSWDIYAQRVDSSGTVMWQDNGIAVCAYAGEQSYLEMVEDGKGGAIVCWNDNRSGEYDIYVQRIDADGNLLWSPPDGVPVCTASGWQWNPDPATDGQNGAIIAWQDGRADYNIYVQRVDSNGACRWTSDGVPVCTAVDVQEYPEMTTDNAGGAIVTWEDRRDGDDLHIYAQRVDSDGATGWVADGVAICTAPAPGTGGQCYPKIIADHIGGAVICWEDSRSDPFKDIYAQRVDSAGQVQWALDGIPVCDAPDEQHLGSQGDVITSDGSGGAIVAWTDWRSGMDSIDVYAQRVSHDGVALWDSNGVAISRALWWQRYPSLVSDGRHGAIISWFDVRAGNRDIYAHKVDSAGVVGTGVGEMRDMRYRIREARLMQNCPNPFNRETVIRYQLAAPAPVSLRIYDRAGQLVRTLVDEFQEAGFQTAAWDGKDDNADPVASGIYFSRLAVYPERDRWAAGPALSGAEVFTATKKLVLLR